jgi:hypothetical protein
MCWKVQRIQLFRRRRHVPMIRYIIVSIGSGILFALMDGVMNANPLAQRLYKVFEPIARKSINVPAGLAIDLFYGFVMAGVFLVIYESLPGESKILRGLLYGLLLWFFRVAMQVATQWMMFNIPASTLLYTLACGFVEMIIIGLLYGLTLKYSATI